MNTFFGSIFIEKAKLKEAGVEHPIKLEYYKTESEVSNKNNIKETKFGIEVIKTSYIKEEVKVENSKITEIAKDERIVDKILEILKRNEVTPVCAEYIVEDLLKEIG